MSVKRRPLRDEVRLIDFTGGNLSDLLRSVAAEVKKIDQDNNAYVLGINTEYGTIHSDEEWMVTLSYGTGGLDDSIPVG